MIRCDILPIIADCQPLSMTAGFITGRWRAEQDDGFAADAR